VDWKVIAALAVLGLAILGALVISILTSVNRYAKQLTDQKPDPRRGFEVKSNAGGESPVLPEKKDDHHG
jgi:hypothetical protein